MQLSDAVFVGEVLTVALDTEREWRREVVFAATETWTSDTVTQTQMSVDVPYSVWECGDKRPAVGETWLVYATAGAGDRLEMGHCDRSRAIGPDDPEPGQLGPSCAPVSREWLTVEPPSIRAGDTFTVNALTTNFVLFEVTAVVSPTGAAAMDPSCPNPCATSGPFRMTALRPGDLELWVSMFGERVFCSKGNIGFMWAYPSASTTLHIEPGDVLPGAGGKVWLPRVSRGPP
jgi:hypothetical protein